MISEPLDEKYRSLLNNFEKLEVRIERTKKDIWSARANLITAKKNLEEAQLTYERSTVYLSTLGNELIKLQKKIQKHQKGEQK
jgi:hypothetical protein